MISQIVEWVLIERAVATELALREVRGPKSFGSIDAALRTDHNCSLTIAEYCSANGLRSLYFYPAIYE